MSADKNDSVLIQNERDALHILPLSFLPIQTPGLRRARMIKNAQLISVVELFNDENSGSGQLGVSDLPNEFDWAEGSSHPDMILLRKVAALPSYDVYSLRIALRQLDINVEDVSALRLSDDMNRELGTYMTDFTRPLIAQIYGDSDGMKIETFEDVVALFRDPDVKKALEKLKIMAAKLGIAPDDVPAFIEDYGDIFMSLSFYRRCLDAIAPIISDFLESVPDLRDNFSLKTDASFQKTLTMLENKVNDLTIQITGRFESFERSTQNMWDDISAEKFRDLQRIIKSYHVTLGGVLCSLSVKMDAWHHLFPKRDIGSPQRRADFIMTEMRHGMDRVAAESSPL